MPKLRFEYDAMNQYMSWQDGDRKTLRKLNRILTDLQRDPFYGVGKFEKLKYQPGVYSRRLDEANRIVYTVNGDTVNILSCKGHYDDN